MADMENFYNDLIIINLYDSAFWSQYTRELQQ